MDELRNRGLLGSARSGTAAGLPKDVRGPTSVIRAAAIKTHLPFCLLSGPYFQALFVLQRRAYYIPMFASRDAFAGESQGNSRMACGTISNSVNLPSISISARA